MEKNIHILKLGLDIGSTTAKLVVIDKQDEIIFSKYERHNADIHNILLSFLKEVKKQFGNCLISPVITGSVGMGLAENYSLPFIQEVVTATELVRKKYPQISTIIDIGGEDAKIVYVGAEGATDLRMNGNCAGGTGAFIDQMSILLGVNTGQLNDLALQAQRVYPIASRCGVFSKTDIQNLISKNVSKEDIAASIFHAVSVQTIVTLSHGCSINPIILFCGGPLTFIPALGKAFIDYLGLKEEDYLIPENANIFSAWGSAICAKEEDHIQLERLITLVESRSIVGIAPQTKRLEPIFESEAEYKNWKLNKENGNIIFQSLDNYKGDVYLGIDSGSTTTKIVVINEKEELLFRYYVSNGGDPISTVKEGINKLLELCIQKGAQLSIKGSCSTGYGEDLIKAAFNLDTGIIETIAHYRAAMKMTPDVDFILDIGGQDMKAMFVEEGVLSRMELNEACSSGCGSFIETFAKSLNYTLEEFAGAACTSLSPCDLGTRCTVFMNSKVKQVLREGASVGDIAAGLSYSVIKNCLYKVLRLRKLTDLGTKIVVQGGTMRNNSVVRALEKLVGVNVYRSSFPELMGAYGCALYAKALQKDTVSVPLEDFLNMTDYTVRQLHCRGCENQCLVNSYKFKNNNIYFSGNKCEKSFSNKGEQKVKGRNASVEKYNLIFEKNSPIRKNTLTIGIPRCLGLYEDYIFWAVLFEECGLNVCLSAPSTYKKYEEGVHSVMSDNICFPAKLSHSHIYDLVERGVDRIFFPYTVYEKIEKGKQSNSYNCPIVSGYSDVIKSVVDSDIPIDSPTITFKDEKLLRKACVNYLSSLGVTSSLIKKAVKKALDTVKEYENKLVTINETIFSESVRERKITILLAGRPYHTDPLIQHKLSEMIAEMGANVITEDILRNNSQVSLSETHHVTQWAYINRILKSAKWVAQQGNNVHFMQMTSFGCGPDAFLLDEVKDILNRHGKSLTILKIDDVNNIGSLKLRVRSVIESLKFNENKNRPFSAFTDTKIFLKEDKKRKIIAPFFTDYISPLLPSLFKLGGYEIITLPKSDDNTVENGLKYANNEVCYPATLIVGDILKVLDGHHYSNEEVAVAITQTGGQCRASNYLALIKKAMVEAGYSDIPVISVSLGSGLMNEQPGFKVNWLKILPIAFTTVLYSDCIAKFYHASVVREREKGAALKLKNYYLEKATGFIEKNDSKGILNLLSEATESFNTVVKKNLILPRVGVVGEIFLKFHSYANKNVINWLMDKEIEVMPPTLTNFFLQAFVNQKVNKENYQERSLMPSFLWSTLYSVIKKQIDKVNAIASKFTYYIPFDDIFKEADHAKGIISLSAQYGEGWLLPSEVIAFANMGVKNVISLQPFGCIANHIVSKGVEKKIKTKYPDINLLSLDYDGGVSEVNITNRLLLFINNLK